MLNIKILIKLEKKYNNFKFACYNFVLLRDLLTKLVTITDKYSID